MSLFDTIGGAINDASRFIEEDLDPVLEDIQGIAERFPRDADEADAFLKGGSATLEGRRRAQNISLQGALSNPIVLVVAALILAKVIS